LGKLLGVKSSQEGLRDKKNMIVIDEETRKAFPISVVPSRQNSDNSSQGTESLATNNLKTNLNQQQPSPSIDLDRNQVDEIENEGNLSSVLKNNNSTGNLIINEAPPALSVRPVSMLIPGLPSDFLLSEVRDQVEKKESEERLETLVTTPTGMS
jgi:hypothetical protein